MPPFTARADRWIMAVILLVPMVAQAAPAITGVGYEQQRLVDGTEIGIWYPITGEISPHAPPKR